MRSVVPLAGHGLRPTTLRRRASRPQLKRDPLGSIRLSGAGSVTHLPLLVLRLTLQSPDTAAVAAVRTAVEHAPIEVFGKYSGKVRVRELEQLDVDGDGVPEVFVWIEPSLQPTPPRATTSSLVTLMGCSLAGWPATQSADI